MKPSNSYRFITIIATAFTPCLVRLQSGNGIARRQDRSRRPGGCDFKSDELFRQREDLAKLREAVKMLGAIRNPNQPEILRSNGSSRNTITASADRRRTKGVERAFEAGKQAGRIASRIEPSKPDGHFWFGANLGDKLVEAQLPWASNRSTTFAKR
ncbi:MAG: hypothetical protein IPJ30_24010 [Acidobacteria bacterium]|nr:hypothetical protein [Acidobacteriota bacterium]